jgi:phosphoribosylformimino-5-aminoimidazole carboxamide ribotide isomerase
MTGRALTLYPAIDILDGKAVRLVKGDFDAKKVYDEDPLQAAAAWVADGASHLHVVDLDGARAGEPRNLHQLQRIVQRTGVPVQYGGGLRTLQAVEQALRAGAARVVLGTAAFADPRFLEQALSHWPGQVLVSVDARGGRVTTSGWTQTSANAATDAIAVLTQRGAHDLVYTDVDRDGMLEGPHIASLSALLAAATGARLIYSGGIGALQHLEALAALPQGPLAGVIVGKALYEKRFTVAQALQALAGDSAHR